MTALTRLRALVDALNSPQSKRPDTQSAVLYEARREAAGILAEMEAASPDVAQAAPKPEIERINELEKTLWLFREFVSRNATQWVIGAGNHHHPMWGMIAEILGDSVGYMPTTLGGSEWRFVQADNREPLSPVPSTDHSPTLAVKTDGRAAEVRG